MTAKCMTERIKRVAAYCRVSTEEQKKHGYSISAQKMKLGDYVDAHADMMLVDFYIDDGVSAVKVGKRLALQRLLQDVKDGKIDRIIFTKLDRWGRSVGIYYQIQSVLDEYGVIWKAIDEDYEIETSAGKFKVNIMMSVAQQERDRCSERIKDAFEYKLKNVEALFGSAATPIGFKVENKQIVHDPDTEQAVYALIDYYCTFRSVRKAMVYMREEFDMDISYKSILTLFKSTLLYGSYRGNDKYCKPYVTKDKFDKMQKYMGKNIKNVKTDRTYIFSRMLVCPGCGGHLVGFPASTVTKTHKFRYEYYRCNRAFNGMTCDFRKSLSQTSVEKMLLESLDKFMTDYIVDCEVKSEEKAKKKRSESSIRNEMNRLNDIYMKGRIDVDEYDLKYVALERELKDATEPQIKPSNAVLGLKGVNLQALYKSFTDEEKSAFWHGLIDDIEIDYDRKIVNVIFCK